MDDAEHQRNKATSGSKTPPHKGGDAARQTQEWGGGTKGPKGPVTKADKRNPNSSAKS